jgi:hypothetical protein
MSLQTDIVTALADVASGQIYPQFATADIDLPFVIYRILNKSPLGTLSDGTVEVNTIVEFDCYADSYSEALTLAESVKAAIGLSGLTFYESTAPGESYEQDVDVFMEPVFFGFWHT